MRRIFVLPVLLLAAGVAACTPEMVVETPNRPTAGVRFIHAVPDLGELDVHFIDVVENSAFWNFEFRGGASNGGGVTSSADVQYKPALAGDRHLRVFLAGTPTILVDTVLTLDANTNYTMLLWGYQTPGGAGRPAGAQAMRFTLIDETLDIQDTEVGLRVINASSETIDATFYLDGGTGPGTSNVSVGLGPLSVGTHVTTAPDEIRFNVRPAGEADTVRADGLGIVGTAAITEPPGPIDARPGTTVGGSAVTAIYYDEPVPGTATASMATSSGFQMSTGNTVNLFATADGYGRLSGDFTDNEFFVGQVVSIEGFTNTENNGLARITAVDEEEITVEKIGGTVVEAGTTDEDDAIGATTVGYTRTDGSFIDEGFTVGQTVNAEGFGEQATDEDAVLGVGPAGGYTRTAGSFLDEGFTVGQMVNATGFEEDQNNGESEVMGVTDLILTVDRPLVAEAALGGRSIVNADPPQNSGTSTVTAVTDNLLTVDKDGGTVLESEITGRSIMNADPREITGVRRWTMVWDRRPPRPPGV